MQHNKNQWNRGYLSGDYSHISALAIGAYAPTDFINATMFTPAAGDYYDYWAPLIMAVDMLSSQVQIGISVLGKIVDTILNVFVADFSEPYTKGVYGFAGSFGFDHIISLNRPTFYDDYMVHLPSQLAINNQNYSSPLFKYEDFSFAEDAYKGFDRDWKKFDFYNCDIYKMSRADYPPVVHNLEARDKTIISKILRRLSFGDNESSNTYFDFRDKIDGTLAVTGLNRPYPLSTLDIPSQYNGKMITEIDNYAFAQSDYKQVALSANIVRIGLGAFSDSAQLTKVTIEQGSGLVTVDDGAFALPIPQKLGYQFAVWQEPSRWELMVIDKGSTGNRDLAAIWYGKEYTYNIYGYQEIRLDTDKENSGLIVINTVGCTLNNAMFIVGDNVKQVTFIGSASNMLKFSVIITRGQYQPSQEIPFFYLRLYFINATGCDELPFFENSPNARTFLALYGTNVIRGGKGKLGQNGYWSGSTPVEATAGGMGAPGLLIDGPFQTLDGTGTLDLYGGSFGYGGKKWAASGYAEDGSYGNTGAAGTSAVINNPNNIIP